MIVRCVDTEYSSLSKNKGLVAFLNVASGEEYAQNLELGGEYLVVAIATGPSSFWLFLDDRFRGLKYPLIYPAPLFEVLETHLSKFWKRGGWIDNQGAKHTLLAPERWAQDSRFHEKLFEGDRETLEAYDEMRALLYAEYPLPWIDSKATALESGNWVTDKDYEEQWEADSQVAMTQNPKTKELLHNPLYSPLD